eukprot:gene18623-18492_t
MSGSVIFDRHVPLAGVHDHFDMVTDLGTLRLHDPRRFGAVVFAAGESDPVAQKLLGHLGVEPLGDDFDTAAFLAGLRQRKAPIKQVLLAGEVVVGVGNIYASEALFLAGIRPTSPANRISKPRVAKLHAAIKDVLSRAVEKGGSTLRDFSNANGESGYFQLEAHLLAEWLKDHELLDAGVEERLLRLETQLRSDKVMVAFVAEFSRGKSEMINALFFAGYGRRIMPASAGRTTMCPTEMGYDADVPPCLRLLPIETRLQPQALMEWRMAPEKWARIDLDVNNPMQLAKALEKVAETRKVTQDEARALGFWHAQAPDDNPMVDAQGMVEVPRWRHALINIAHPLLKQGLVILDTPGLNAIGAEPELTVSLIPQAHAVVFMLGADTGVTKSDLSIWREHLITESTDPDARLVVLNKIDTLWDALSTSAQIQAQIDRQRANTADILGIPKERVIAVSAQKGLVAKVTEDEVLLRQSCLPVLEDVLGHGMMGKRQQILASAMKGGITDLRAETGRVINIRK